MIPDSESSKKILKRNVSKKVFHNGKNNCVRLLIFQLNFIDLQKIIKWELFGLSFWFCWIG